MGLALLKRIGLLVLGVAVGIGVIGKFKPELFLRIPHVGFIPWAITGNPMPPCLRDDAWQPGEHQTWLKDGDLVVTPGSKSGTTWMLFCTHQIRTKGSDQHNFTDVSLSTPWPDLVQAPGLSWEETKAGYNTTILRDGTPLKQYWDHPSFPFRIFKSHYTPQSSGGSLPVNERPGVKYLAMARNGLDVVWSFVPFFASHNENFRAMWGGFPPPSGTKEDRLNDLLPGGMLEHMYFHYVRQWWEHRHDKNVLLLHYSDAKRDLPGVVSRIAEFMGVELTPEEKTVVLERCSMPYMKKHSKMFVYQLPLNPDADGVTLLQDGANTRRGLVGEGTTQFSADEIARWQAAEEEYFVDPELVRWAREGGGDF